MKKSITVLLFLSVLISGVCSTPNPSPASSRGFTVEGGVGKYNNIYVQIMKNAISEETPIGSFSEGVPFELSDPSVQYSGIKGSGRVIGYWSIASNAPSVRISVTATDLKCVGKPDKTIRYYIAFHIVYASFLTNGQYDHDVMDDIVVKSGNEAPYVYAIDNSVGENPFPVVSYNQDIRVYLAEGVDPLSADLPFGLYESTVTISVAGE